MTETVIEKQRENVEADPPDRELETDDDNAEPSTEEPKEEEALFDKSEYEREDLALPKIDGQQIDRLSVKFSGTVFLERSNPNDVALYRRLKLGHEVTLNIEARVSGAGAKGATDREGDLDVVVGEKAVKVQTVYVPTVEELAA